MVGLGILDSFVIGYLKGKTLNLMKVNALRLNPVGKGGIVRYDDRVLLGSACIVK